MKSNLFSATRSKILMLFFSHPEKEFYINQVIRTLGLGNGVVQNELKNLSNLGIIAARHLGNLCLYQANKQSPIYSEIKGLIIKTFGIAGEIATALSEFKESIQIAFIFGSFANGEITLASDIDIFIITNLSFHDISRSLAQAQQTLDREINPVVFSKAEFKNRIKSGDGFLLNVLKGDKIFIVGGENELGAMVAKWMDKKAGIQSKPNSRVDDKSRV